MKINVGLAVFVTVGIVISIALISLLISQDRELKRSLYEKCYETQIKIAERINKDSFSKVPECNVK